MSFTTLPCWPWNPVLGAQGFWNCGTALSDCSRPSPTSTPTTATSMVQEYCNSRIAEVLTSKLGFEPIQRDEQVPRFEVTAGFGTQTTDPKGENEVLGGPP